MTIKTKKKELEIPEIHFPVIQIKIKSLTGYIPHKWSKETIENMLRKHMGLPPLKKKAKDPQKDYEDCFYKTPSGKYGIPSTAFKNAMINACRNINGLKMTEAKQAFFVLGDLTEITKGKPRMRQDMVRNETGVPDIRFRPEFTKWEADLTIEYDSGVLSDEQIVNILNYAGRAVGIGDWRPAGKKSSGPFGRFEVVTEKRKKKK